MSETVSRSRVVLVSPLPPPSGGIATWTMRVLASPDFRRKVDISLVDTAIRAERVDSLRHRSLWQEAIRTIGILRNASRMLRPGDPGIVHVNTACSYLGMVREFVVARLAVRRGWRVILHCRCDIEYQLHDSQRVIRMFDRLLKLASIAIVLNSSSALYVTSRSGVRCDILPNFVDSEGIWERPGVTAKVERVVFTGRVSRAKGCDVVAAVATHFPAIQFDLLGSVSEDMAGRALPGNVTLHGECAPEEISTALRSADLFLFPSRSEGFSNSLLEAMATGLPCIATRVGANEDMLEDSGGILVDVGDVDGLIEALGRLSADHGARARMSSWNLNKVRTAYGRELVLSNLVALYEELWSS